jgi:hypothetical protein
LETALISRIAVPMILSVKSSFFCISVFSVPSVANHLSPQRAQRSRRNTFDAVDKSGFAENEQRSALRSEWLRRRWGLLPKDNVASLRNLEGLPSMQPVASAYSCTGITRETQCRGSWGTPGMGLDANRTSVRHAGACPTHTFEERSCGEYQRQIGQRSSSHCWRLRRSFR